MTPRFVLCCLLAVLTGIGAIGCQETALPVAESVSTPIAAPEATTATEPLAADGPTLADNKPESNTSAKAQFSPPFPERLELFEPPKRAQSAVRHDDAGGETVELKGFMNVDRPRVVLSIDGVIAPMAEGGEKYGVQVISIQPPSVVLQRGRSRWTATLE